MDSKQVEDTLEAIPVSASDNVLLLNKYPVSIYKTGYKTAIVN